MTLGEKIAKLRRESNYTQEQLADVLGVSRQSVSKWESDIAFPETDKIIRISEIFDCSLDYLLKESESDENRNVNKDRSDRSTDSEASESVKTCGRGFCIKLSATEIKERKSNKTIFGMPLYHIGKNAKGFFALGLNAKGVVAVGLKATGVISLGILSLGIVSFGVLALGLLAFGMFSVGLFAAGVFALGVVAAGAISFGAVSMGAVAIGDFSFGACAIGKYYAYGDKARAIVAIGKTGATGELFEKVGELTKADIAALSAVLDEKVPVALLWIKNIIVSLL